MRITNNNTTHFYYLCFSDVPGRPDKFVLRLEKNCSSMNATKPEHPNGHITQYIVCIVNFIKKLFQ